MKDNNHLLRSINRSSVELAKLCATLSTFTTENPNSREINTSSGHHLENRLSRYSNSNPYFGYPIHFEQEADSTSVSNNRPVLRHGRRRKRDLLRALIFLFWQRWKRRISAGLVLLMIFLFYSIFRRRQIGRRFRMKLLTWGSS